MKVLYLDVSELEKTLNLWGDAGWRVGSVTHIGPGKYTVVLEQERERL